MTAYAPGGTTTVAMALSRAIISSCSSSCSPSPSLSLLLSLPSLPALLLPEPSVVEVWRLAS